MACGPGGRLRAICGSMGQHHRRVFYSFLTALRGLSGCILKEEKNNYFQKGDIFVVD